LFKVLEIFNRYCPPGFRGCVITPVLLAIMQKYGKKIIEK
jgi:hypothetical protein